MFRWKKRKPEPIAPPVVGPPPWDIEARSAFSHPCVRMSDEEFDALVADMHREHDEAEWEIPPATENPTPDALVGRLKAAFDDVAECIGNEPEDSIAAQMHYGDIASIVNFLENQPDMTVLLAGLGLIAAHIRMRATVERAEKIANLAPRTTLSPGAA